MTTCQGCKEQLLEYVYGLLDANDPAEAGTLTALRAHLETCASCQAAYEQAKKQQQLLGEASRAKTALTFSAPKAEAHRSRFVHQRATYVAWYVTAACLVFALILGSGTAYWWGKATKWNNVELAQAQLDRLRTPANDLSDKFKLLEQQVNTQNAMVEKLAKNVKTMEEQEQQKLAASTSYQQMLAPDTVEVNNDTPISLWNSTLTGQPALMSEVASNLRDSVSQKTIRQQNPRNETPSYKLNFDLPAVAYEKSAGKDLVNEVVQDTSSKMALGKVVHPLHVLSARYAAHLCTDKPIYQPGETVYFRGLALEKTTFQAPHEELHYTFKLTGPDEKVLKQWTKTAQLVDPNMRQPLKDVRGQVIQGIGGEFYQLPANMPLGECQLTLTEKSDRFDPQTVKFMVNNIAAPRFDKQLQFNRASYTPGDEVVLSGKIKLPSQQPWVHGTIKGQILIDGNKYDVLGQKSQTDIQSSTDASGNVKLAFRLPAQVEAGQGTLSLQLVSNDGIETWSHPLRIETGALQVDCYPEGGDLIADVPNHVYFQMHNKYGEAVEGEADLIDSKQLVVQPFSTFHDESEARASRGMGVFVFTPRANESYHIRMKKPASSQVALRLPAVKASGVGLHIDQPILPAGSPLPITLSNVRQPRHLAVSVHCRGVLIALDQLSMAASSRQTILINPNKPLGGVSRVTISEVVTQNDSQQLVPLAERLIYRHPDKVLKLNLKTEPIAGKAVRLMIDSKTETNQPSPAYVTIVGVNKSLLQMAEATTTRRLPAHFLIAQEIRQPEELEFADFFLTQHRSAEHALDLLLGVQGYRRFMELDNTGELKQAGQRQAEKLPVKYISNREEALNRVQTQAKQLTEQSAEGKQLIEAKHKQTELQSQLKEQSKKQTDAVALHRQETATAEKSYQVNLEQWQQFNVWFYMTSSCILGVMSLVGLVAIFIRRSFLPWHLVWTVGMLSVLGIVGAILLGNMHLSQPQPVVIVMVNQQEKLDRKAEEKAAENIGLSSDTGSGEAGSSLKQAQQPLPSDKYASSSKTDLANSPTKSKDETYRSTQPGGAEAMKPGSVASPSKQEPLFDAATGKKDERAATTPSTVVPPPSKGGLALRAGGITQNSKEKDQPARSMGYEQRVPNLTDNRAVHPKEPVAPLGTKAKQNEAVTEEKAAKNPPPPAFAGGMGGGGAGAKGASGNLERSIPKGPGKDKDSNEETRKRSGSRDDLREALKANDVFFVREYSWKSDARPEAMSAATAAWSKTIYWHPLQVIPRSGKLDIPIELPSSDGAYHFEVFGHDGEGRLGASSIEVKASSAPISLKLKLATTEAKVGDTVRLECQVQNLSSRRQPDVHAKIQLPEGVQLSPNFKQLRYAVKKAKPDEALEPTRWYVQGRELTFVWSELGSDQRVKLNIELNCTKAGAFTGAPSRAYLENQEQDATHVPGLSIKIKPAS